MIIFAQHFIQIRLLRALCTDNCSVRAEPMKVNCNRPNNINVAASNTSKKRDALYMTR